MRRWVCMTAITAMKTQKPVPMSPSPGPKSVPATIAPLRLEA